jgi:hypothetical protein
VSQGSKPLLVSTTSSALEFLSSVRLFLSRNGAFRELSLVVGRNLRETGSFGYFYYFFGLRQLRWFSFLANRIFKKKLVVIKKLLLQLFFAFYLSIYLSICIVGVFCGLADFLYPLTVSVLSVVFQFCVSVFQCFFFFLLPLSSSTFLLLLLLRVLLAIELLSFSYGIGGELFIVCVVI